MMMPEINSTFTSLVGLVLAGLGIAYQGGFFGKKKKGK
jgi:hypothetical protein